jgi:L-lactate dehydrogenase complex protein LldE
MEANLFVTCLADTFYPGAAGAAARVLERLGWRVACPGDQICCGQPMFNAGYFDQARKVARHFLKVFSKMPGPVIAPSSSCTAMVRQHFPRLFADEPEHLETARALGERTFEFSEFLARQLAVDLGKLGTTLEASVTFHYSCHFRALGIRDEPIDLIQQIPGIDYVPLKNMEQCCGFGGTFSLNFPHVSREMVAEKVRAVRETGAEWLIFSDPGCAMNILGYANREGRPLRAMHLAELILKASGGWFR